MLPFRPLLQSQSKEQWSLEASFYNLPSNNITPRLPLGRLWEQCLYKHFQSHPQYSLISQNEQIIYDKVTLGAPDAILQDIETKAFFHLEFAFKLYLLEKGKAPSNWNHWRGTNATDSLQSKWDQFHQKQFALLHRPEAKTFLEKHQIEKWQQRWVLHGMLFVHFSENLPVTETLHNNTSTNINPYSIRGLWCLADEVNEIDWSQWTEIHKKNLLLPYIIFPLHSGTDNPYPMFYKNSEEERMQQHYLVIVQEGWPSSTM